MSNNDSSDDISLKQYQRRRKRFISTSSDDDNDQLHKAGFRIKIFGRGGGREVWGEHFSINYEFFFCSEPSLRLKRRKFNVKGKKEKPNLLLLFYRKQVAVI